MLQNKLSGIMPAREEFRLAEQVRPAALLGPPDAFVDLVSVGDDGSFVVMQDILHDIPAAARPDDVERHLRSAEDPYPKGPARDAQWCFIDMDVGLL